jgi:NodT family efflux transporter outer membrane factor (OMF) lipoprotein
MMRIVSLHTGSALAAAALLSACAVGPDYRPPASAALKVPARYVADPGVPVEADLAHWWASFGDPVLSGLVERSLAANLDIDAAGARLRQARASLRGAQGGLLPTLGASGSVSRSIGQGARTVIDPTSGQTISTGGDTTVYRAGFDASYEVDIFGGIRRSIEAARADAATSEANLHAAQISVASEVALNYLNARLASGRLAIAKANLAAQDETLQIVGWRVQAGLVSALDYEQARQLRAQTAASIPALEQSYVAAVNRIAVLLGETPGAVTAEIGTGTTIPLPPRAIGAGLPADMLQRRPDVAAAERTLAAETARIGVATADLYPALRLTGSFSGTDTVLGNLLSAGVGSIAGAITAPIFEGGQLRARVAGQRASADAALAAYRSAVLTAIEDVENALTALGAAERRETEAIVSADAAQNAVTYARSQYQAGLIDFQSLLDSERSLLSSQDSRASARADRATAAVQLYKALGGGWEAAPTPASATTAQVGVYSQSSSASRP